MNIVGGVRSSVRFGMWVESGRDEEGWPCTNACEISADCIGLKTDHRLLRAMKLAGMSPPRCVMKPGRLSPALRHRSAALEPTVGVLTIGCNGATLHRLASLEAVHIVALDAARSAVGVLLIVIAATLSRGIYSVGSGVGLAGILRHSPWRLVALRRRVSVGRTSVTHDTVQIARGARLALRSRISRVPLRLACSRRAWGCTPGAILVGGAGHLGR